MDKRKSIFIGIIGLAVIGIALFALLRGQGAKEGQLAAVTVGTVEKTDLNASIFATGRVLASEERSLYAELQAGKVKTLLVSEGQQVAKGQVLAELDTEDIDNQIKSAQIQLSIAKENLSQVKSAGQTNFDLSLETAQKAYNDAKKSYDDKLVLFNSGAISLVEKDAAKTALDRAQTELTAAQRNYNNYGKQSQINIANLNLKAAENTLSQLNNTKAKSKVLAPFDGVISKVNVKEGAPVSAAAPLFVLSQTAPLIVETNISEFDVDLLSIGQEAIITGDGFEESYTGKVSYIAPVAESVISGQSTETVVKVKIALNEENTKFKPNFSANVEIKTANLKGVLTIPYEAIYTTKEGEKWVFVVKDGSLKQATIKTGVEGDLSVEVIGSVLAQKDQVVLNPTEELKDGLKVNVKNPAGDAK